MHSFVRLRTTTVVAGIVVSLVLSLLGGTGTRPAEVVKAQDGSVSRVFPVIFTTDPDGVMRGYNIDGDFIDEETFEFSFDIDPTDLEDFAVDYVTRANGPVVIAADVDAGFVWVSNSVIDSSSSGFRVFDTNFADGDRLFTANLDRSNERAPTKVVPDHAVKEIVIVRGDTGLIDVYQYQSRSGFPIVHIDTLDLGIDDPANVVIGDIGATESSDDSERFGRDGLAEIFVVDPATGQARVFDHTGKELETLSFFLEFGPGDHLVMGNANGVGGEEILVANPDTGEVHIYEVTINSQLELLRNLIQTINVGFDSDDQIDLTDVNGNGIEEILVAQSDTGDVDVFRYDLVEQTFFSEPSLSIGYSADDIFTTTPVRHPDADGDGLFDHWETHGVDVNGDGIIDIDLPNMGADPRHKDLFVEYDYTAGEEPSRAAVQLVKDSFAAAPVDAGGVVNPDREPGINLWIDTGDLTEGGQLVGDDLGGGQQIPQDAVSDDGICLLRTDFDDVDFADIKDNEEFFDPIRTHVFRYGLSVNKPFDCVGGGEGELGGNDFVEHINSADPQHDTIDEAGMFMHELGHNLGLLHGGFEDHNCKPNHISVMNYSHNFGIHSVGGGQIIDYSPSQVTTDQRATAPLPDLIEESLDETHILDPTDTRNMVVFSDPDGWSVRSPVNVKINWNANTDDGNDIIDTERVSANIDNLTAHRGCGNDDVRNKLNPLQGHDDWGSIVLTVRNGRSSAAGAVVEPPFEEPTIDELIELKEELHTSDLTIDLSADADQAIAGTELDFTITVKNLGPNPADEPEIEIILPDGLSFQDSDADCTFGSDPQRCSLDQLLAGESATITVTVLIRPDLVYESGGPVSVTTGVSIENTVDVASDPDTSNNSAEVETNVVAEADLEAVELVAPDDPVDVLLDRPSTLQVVSRIANHGPSSPIDAGMQIDASPVDGVEISHTGPNINLALGTGELRRVIATLNVHCTEPGLHTVSLTGTVNPLNSEDTDPDATNNQASDSLAVRCVVPVAINIKPGSHENPVSLQGNTRAPVAALTTEAGEYDLPREFDATEIDPLSVRFGTPDALFDSANPEGASEVHQRGHIEDALELDEETLDDDLDMVLHFDVFDAGLGPDDTEACIRGQYTTADGDTFTFFGCDVIRFVP